MPNKTRLIVGGVLIAVLAAVAFLLTRGDGDDGGSPDRSATRTATAAASPEASGSTNGAFGGTASRTGAAPASSAPAPSVPPGMSVVRVGQLPAEARETLRLIDAGGPFPYAKDGSVFGNREGRLPEQKSGYYREYTVETPGSDDRGARRVITGSSGERYYTSDHYATFRVIVP